MAIRLDVEMLCGYVWSLCVNDAKLVSFLLSAVVTSATLLPPDYVHECMLVRVDDIQHGEQLGTKILHLLITQWLSTWMEA